MTQKGSKSIDGMLVSSSGRGIGAHAHAPQAGSTLMRKAVQRPGDALRQHSAITDSMRGMKPANAVHKKIFVDEVNPSRLERATAAARSQVVQHYGEPAVSAAPTSVTVTTVTSQPIPEPVAAVPAPPPMSTDALLERAIALAPTTSARRLPHPRTNRIKKVTKRISISVVSLAIAFGIGFGVYKVIPGAGVQVASVRAGLSADLPSYHPGSFKLSDSASDKGLLSLEYSAADGKTFTISEQKTSWSDKELVANYISGQSADYTPFSNGTHTIYLYGNQNASWIIDGVWYKITSNGSLSQDELLQVINSM